MRTDLRTDANFITRNDLFQGIITKCIYLPNYLKKNKGIITRTASAKYLH